jgi:RNA polymerase sigma-70 factor (ECF subfamily)
MEQGSNLRAAEGERVDEVDLVRRLRAGDESAFEQMVRLYGGRMLATARRLTGRDEDAADALQEAFLAAHKSIDGFEEKSRLSTWLHRIVVNASLLRMRSRRRIHEVSIESLLPHFLEDGHPEEPAAKWGDSVERNAQRNEMRGIVRDLVLQLPEIYRTVLVLRDIEEVDTQETARILGIEVNAVKVRLHRARQALRALLDRRFREERRDV